VLERAAGREDVSKKKVTISKASLLVAAVATIALIVTAGIAFFVLSKDDQAEAAPVTAEPVNTSVNPFMPPAGTDQTNVTPPLPAAPPTAAAPPPAVRYPGNTEGLYGGTLNNHTCDAKKMIDFFAVNPDKAAAWAGVLGIQVQEIATYLTTLTPVVLRSDTYVRNHGWDDGRATSFVSVLQAGTAVFVNTYGIPVVKCYCGNPLTPWYPPVSFKPRWRCGCPYPEPYWPHWGKTTIVIIERTTVIIDKFTLVDTTTGKPFVRPAGPTTTDTAYVAPGASSAPPATPAGTQPAPPLALQPLLPTEQAPPPVTAQAPTRPQVTGATALRLLRSRVQKCEQQGVRYPWEQAVSQKDSYYQIGTVLRWIVTIQDTTATGSTKDFSFEVDPVADTVQPSNSWARRAAEHCPGLTR
jgi:hypothetical protein